MGHVVVLGEVVAVRGQLKILELGEIEKERNVKNRRLIEVKK